MTASSSGPSPPEWMRTCEPSLADGAKVHVREVQKKRSSFLPTLGTIRKQDKGKGKVEAVLTRSSPEIESVFVELADKRKHKEDGSESDQFRWAILYENQRGITIFSTAYYSGRSLLPHDPPPFTVPDSGESSPDQHSNHAPPNVTLITYPLPDPTWRWVSKSWLVDMRGDGDVQYDGFEYNWVFRRHGWGAQVGWLGMGGYVRRRRWMRLMMRPSDARLEAEIAIEHSRHEDAAGGSETDQIEDTLVWRGDEGDWNRVRKALKSLTRDGPRLDLWEDWLSDFIGKGTYTPPHHRESSEGRSARSTPDADAIADYTSRSQEHPHRQWILTVLREHGSELRCYFVYPDSRAQLRDLLVMAGLVLPSLGSRDLTSGPHKPSSTAYAPDLSTLLLGPEDFWSRSSELNLAASTEDKL